MHPSRRRYALAALLAGPKQRTTMSGGGPDLPPPGSSAAWLARSVRDAEVAGSNPAFPTDKALVRALRKSSRLFARSRRARSVRDLRARDAVRDAHGTLHGLMYAHAITRVH